MDLFEDSARLVKVLLEEGIQPLELPRADGEGRSRAGAELPPHRHCRRGHTGNSGCAEPWRKDNDTPLFCGQAVSRLESSALQAWG